MGSQDYPDGPAVKTLSSNAKDVGLTPGQGAMIPGLVDKNAKHKTEAIL